MQWPGCCSKKRWHIHVTPVFVELHWLSIKQQIDYKNLLFTYILAFKGLAPKYAIASNRTYSPLNGKKKNLYQYLSSHLW